MSPYILDIHGFFWISNVEIFVENVKKLRYSALLSPSSAMGRIGVLLNIHRAEVDSGLCLST